MSMTISRRSLLAASGSMALLGRYAFAETTPMQGGTIVAIVQPEPSVMTTSVNGATPQGVVSTNIFDGLVRFDNNAEVRPSLATGWQVSADGKSISFKLRHDVRWHDGQPFTSADVAFSIMHVLKKYNSRARLNLAIVESVDTPDDHTAVLRLSRPSPVILKALNASDGQIIPRHLYEGTDILKNPHNIKPIGTGAFRFKEWRRSETILLERNPDYWDKGTPMADRLIFRIIPDAATRVAALETGEAQYAPWDALPFSDVSRIKKVPGLAISTDGYNYSNHMMALEFNMRRPYVSDARVRRAIAHAIDRRKFVDTVWYGVGKPANSIIPTTLPEFHTDKGANYEYDIALANKMLDEAGYPRKADGTRFALSQVYLPFNEGYRRSAEYIKQCLVEIGIGCTVQNQDVASYVRKVFTEYDFDFNTNIFACGIDPDLGMTRYLWSKAIEKGVPWTNASGYSSPEMDKIIEAQKVELDTSKRAALLHKMQELVQTELPLLPLMESHHVTVYSTRLKGLSTAPDGSIASLKNVSIEKQSR